MKRLFPLLAMAASASLFIVSCTKVAEPEFIEQPEAPALHHYTFNLGSATKSVLAQDAGGRYGAWEEGDLLGSAVNTAAAGSSVITLGHPCSFTVSHPSGLKAGDVVYAYYPYHSGTAYARAAQLSIPTAQSQTGTSFDFDAMPMAGIFEVSVPTYTDDTPVGDMNLYNLASLIDFKIFSSTPAYTQEIIQSVQFSANAPLAGSFTKDLTVLVLDDATSFGITGYGETAIVTNVTEAPAIGTDVATAADVYMVLAPGSYSGTVTVLTNIASYTWTLSSPRDFVRAGVKTLGLNLGAASATRTPHQMVYTENFTSSKASKNAYNCESQFGTQGMKDDFDYEWSNGGKVYVFQSGIRLGTNSATGSVSSSDILGSIPAGQSFTVKVYAALWNKDGGQLRVSYNGEDKTSAPANPAITNTSRTYQASDFALSTDFSFTKAEGQESLTIASTSKRIIIDKVEVVVQQTPLPPTPGVATATVVTEEVGDMDATWATLNGSYSGATGEVIETGFYWGTSPSEQQHELYGESGTGASGVFTKVLSNLSASTTYYYKAYVVEYNAESGQYEYRYGSVESFTTGTPGVVIQEGYLGCYEVPAVAWSGSSTSGRETYGSTNWYTYDTENPKQKVVTHTYSYGGKVYRNYTSLVDKDKKAPLWASFVMHDGAYPDNGVGRTGSWKLDPGIPSDWQQESSGSGYSRGHFVASNYRQTNTDANKETFYYTNQALQWQTGFNDGVWNTMENSIKSAAPTGRDTLYVVVGTLYESSKVLGGVPVPSHFYTCVMKCSFNTSGTMTAAKGKAFLYTNETHKGDKYTDAKFATTIDAIEERTGFDFFPKVPTSLQNAAESGGSQLDL